MSEFQIGPIPLPGGDALGIFDFERGVVTTAEFTTSVSGDDLPYVLEVHLAANSEAGRIELDSLKVRRKPGGPPVDATNLRTIPVGAITRAAIRAATMPVDFTYDEAGNIAGYTFGSSTWDRSVPESVVHELAPRKPRSKAVERDGELRTAAEAYIAARANGEPMYPAVQSVLCCSRATAARRIAAARAAGLIPEEGSS